MPTYIEQSLAKLEEFEGCIPWMYRDTVGKVTAGVGFLLADAEEAQKLPFQIEEHPATAAEIAREFARVEALPMGRPAQFYRRPQAAGSSEAAGSLELLKADIDARLRHLLLDFEHDLHTSLPGYDSLPDAARIALLDMAYNLGPQKLLREYTRLLAAVRAGAWQRAAQMCSRRGPGAVRNEWTRQQFLSLVSTAHTIEAEAEAAGALQSLAFGLLGMAAEFGGAFVRWFNTPR